MAYMHFKDFDLDVDSDEFNDPNFLYEGETWSKFERYRHVNGDEDRIGRRGYQSWEIYGEYSSKGRVRKELKDGRKYIAKPKMYKGSFGYYMPKYWRSMSNKGTHSGNKTWVLIKLGG